MDVILLLSNNQIIIRLLVSFGLSTLIGVNRESSKRPAGLRTHVLVCVSSTLVMLISLFMFERFNNITNLQPDRLGAQVISGIGFLGAGTILREGSSVKGLTTAASLWAVACIGLAIGVGFYLGGILLTIFVLITLITYSRVGKRIKRKDNKGSVSILTVNKPGQLGEICKVIGDNEASITGINIESEEDGLVGMEIDIIFPDIEKKYEILNEIANIDDILEISQKN